MKLNKNCILLFLFCLALYGTFSGLIPLLDPDEPVYGETAKEMLSTGDWLSPRIYGEFWYDKPPLFYWLESISFTLFGISTASARLPSILMGALLSPYLYLSMRKLVGEKAALYGAFISASSLEIIVLARSSVTDATLTFTLTVALISFLRKEYIPAYIFCGLSLLAKGPIGFGFPALIVGLWMIFRGSFTFKNIMALRWTWGIPLACLVGLPWYLAMGMIHGDAFIDTFLGYHNVTRFISPEHAGQNHYWLYLVVLIAGFYPWTGTLPGILRRLRKWRSDPVLFYLIVWALFIFLFFTLSSTQLFSYILPMFPPLSLLAGKYLTEIREAGHVSKSLMGFHLFFALTTAIAISLAPLTPAGGAVVKYGISLFMILSALFSVRMLSKGRMRGFLCSQACSSFSSWHPSGASLPLPFPASSPRRPLQRRSRKQKRRLNFRSISIPSTGHRSPSTRIFTEKPFRNLTKENAGKRQKMKPMASFFPAKTMPSPFRIMPTFLYRKRSMTIGRKS